HPDLLFPWLPCFYPGVVFGEGIGRGIRNADGDGFGTVTAVSFGPAVVAADTVSVSLTFHRGGIRIGSLAGRDLCHPFPSRRAGFAVNEIIVAAFCFLPGDRHRLVSGI